MDDRVRYFAASRELERRNAFLAPFSRFRVGAWSIIHAHSIDDAAGQLSLKNWNVSRSQATVENLKSIFLLAKLAYPLQGSLIREIKERRRRIFDNVKKKRDVLDTLLWISLSDRLGSFVGFFSYNYVCYTDEKMIRSSSVW